MANETGGSEDPEKKEELREQVVTFLRKRSETDPVYATRLENYENLLRKRTRRRRVSPRSTEGKAANKKYEDFKGDKASDHVAPDDKKGSRVGNKGAVDKNRSRSNMGPVDACGPRRRRRTRRRRCGRSRSRRRRRRSRRRRSRCRRRRRSLSRRRRRRSCACRRRRRRRCR